MQATLIVRQAAAISGVQKLRSGKSMARSGVSAAWGLRGNLHL
jgi:hypothetical protein